MFQNTCLFKDTLLNNIKAARPDATREEVLKAADEAQCKDIIDRLPDGLDTLVGTGGTYLSGGENQRIALARAILKTPLLLYWMKPQHLQMPKMNIRYSSLLSG